MAVTLYEVSIPVLLRGLTNLANILKKGEAHADEQKLPHGKLVEARLIDDMGTLAYQIQRVSDSAKGVAVRVGGAEPVSLPDTETTFAELHARVQKTIDILKAVQPASVDGKEETPVVLKVGGGELKFTAKDYLLNFALPNFYFHVVTAYDILRHMGVQVGKMDYLGKPNQ